MKKQKRTILLLSIAMTLIFAGLLIIQFKYIGDTAKLRNNQFNEAVKRSLVDIVNNLGDAEADKYLNIFWIEESKNRQNDNDAVNTNPVTVTFSEKIMTEAFSPSAHLPGNQANDNADDHSPVESTTNILQNRIKSEYYHQKVHLENVAIRWLKETAERPIQERIDFNELDIFIKTALENNGIDIPYHFAIATSNNGRTVEIYRCSDFKETKEQSVFSQELFADEYSDKQNYLRLYFPTKDEYIMSSMTLVLPSVALTTLLLITFTVTLLIIFQQKKLDDIKNDFVSNMTHEFKTPISTISLASQMLQDQGMSKSPETIKSISNIIKSETGRLSFLVEKILLMSIEHEKSTLKLTEVNINELISNSVANFALKVENKGGKLNAFLEAKDAWAKVDEVHFTNVIFNLMDNAVKYSREEEPLMLTVKTWNDSKGFLFISIEDNGMGIKKESLNKVFEKFYRAPTGNVHNVKGFGLGLAYVKKIIDSHKGLIKAESEVNVGTKFIIKIPTLKKID